VNATKKIAILGAGLLGRLLAYELARIGCRVAVFEKNTATHSDAAAYIAAAMLAPLAESVSTETNIVEMGYYSLKRWPSILAGLEQSVFFQQEGSLIVWHQQDQSSAAHFKQQLQSVNQALPNIPVPEMLNKNQLFLLEPQLSQQFEAGIFLPREAQLDNRELLVALLHEGVKLGVQYHWEQSISLKDFPYDHFDDVIDCRGMGSKNDLEQLRGVRGEVLRVFAPEVELKRPTRLIHPKYPLYIAPKRNHLFVIGATEIESEDDSPISVRSTLELLSAAYTVHSGFAEARIIEASAKCRPSFKDNLPRIMRSNNKLLQVNGLYRHGFLIAPAIVDSLLSLVIDNNESTADQFHIAIQESSYENIC